MAISFIGAATAAATTITIPGTYQIGDIILMLAYNNSSVTNPTQPAGWVAFGSSATATTAWRLGYKLAASASETSGTWTTATNLICNVYRGVATNKTPLRSVAARSNVNASLVYPGADPLNSNNTSWVVQWGVATAATNVGSTVPTGYVSRASDTNVGSFDSNGVAMNSAPSVTVTINASSTWVSKGVELLAELPNVNNYQFVKVGDGMSASEKIR